MITFVEQIVEDGLLAKRELNTPAVLHLFRLINVQKMTEKISCIYKINSKVHPDRFYIGSSCNFKNRIWKHKCRLRKNKHNPILQNHYNKYGEDDLSFDVFELCHQNDLLKREQYFIDLLKPYFNASPTASGTRGIKYSSEYCRRDSERNKGEKHPQFGTKHTSEHCQNISNALKGKKKSLEHNKHNSEAHMGQPSWNKGLTKETSDLLRRIGENISKAKMGHKLGKQTEEQIRKRVVSTRITKEKQKQNGRNVSTDINEKTI